MMNISEVNPSEISTEPLPQSGPAPASEQEMPTNLAEVDSSEIQTPEEFNQAQYGSLPQQALAGLEGVAQGVAGPLAPAAEEASGLTTAQDIRGRAEANPWTHGIGEGAGFVAGAALAPEASLPGLAGEIGEHASALLPEATGAIPRILSSGVKTGAEMAALSTSDELSKMVTNDPNQTLESAAINVGLSGILGGAGGAVIGSVSPLWDKTLNKLGIQKLASSYMGETKFLNENPDLVEGAVNELTNRVNQSDSMWSTMSETKPDVLAQAMPEATPENAAKISSQLQDVSDRLTNTIEQAANSVKTKAAVPYLAEDLANFQNVVTDPNASFSDQYSALNNLKTTLEGYAKWGTRFGATEETSAKGALGRTLSNIIRPALEDTGVWGSAGDVQRITNEAISKNIKALKDFYPQITTNTLGENSVAPEKVNGLIKQTLSGAGGRKSTVVQNLLDSTQKYADAIAKVHLDNGLPVPEAAKLDPVPVLNHLLETPTDTGTKLARWAHLGGGAKMASHAAGELGAEAVGGSLGFLVGHPWLGAWMGERVLRPVISGLLKPLAEKALEPSAAKAATEYVGSAYKGQKLLGDAIQNFFKPGALVLGKDLIPDQTSRDKLEKSLEYSQNPQNLMKSGGSLGHYLPDHATAAATTAATAANYFAAIKPKQQQPGMLDDPTPVDKNAQSKYNRALDVAQQPLVVLQHAKNGTLLPQDIQTLQTVYPKLRQVLAQRLGQELVSAKANKTVIPYQQKLGIASIMGQPVDSLMAQPAMLSIMSANAPTVPAAPPIGKPKKVSKSTASSMLKVNSLYQTPEQARASSRTLDAGS